MASGGSSCQSNQPPKSNPGKQEWIKIIASRYEATSRLVLWLSLSTGRTTQIQNNLPAATYLSPHGGIDSARDGCTISGFVLAIGIAQCAILGSLSMVRRPGEGEISIGKYRLVKRAQCILAGDGLAIVNDGSVIGKEIHPASQAAGGSLSGEVEIGLAQGFFQRSWLRGGAGCRVRSSDGGVCLGRRGCNQDQNDR